MSNALIKDTVLDTVVGVEYVPAVPYRPAEPPRTVYESRVVCGFRFSGPGHYDFVTDPITYAVTMVWVPDPGTVAGAGVWACDTETVPVTYPGLPEQPYEPGYTIATPHKVPGFNLGWNSGARSVAFFEGPGYATFQVSGAVVGAIVGLNYYDGLPEVYNGNAIDFAFECTHGFAKVVENGIFAASVGPYTDATVFRIESDGSTVRYKMNGAVVYTSTNHAPPAAAWLEAALYSATDQVFNPTIQAGADGHSTLGASLSPMTFFGAHTGYAQIDTALPYLAAALTSNPWATIGTDMSALEFFGAYAGYAELDGTLETLAFDADVGLIEPSYAILSTDLPAISFTPDGLTGEIGSMAASLTPMVMLSADHPYGEMFATLPAPDGTFSALEGNFRASISARSVATTTMVAPDFLAVTINSHGVLTSVLAAGVLIDVALLAQAALGSTYALQQVLQAVMFSAGRSAAALDDPANDTQTWVVNMDGFGSTTYSNFAFNSFAQIGGVYYGADSSGIYALDGDTDDGALIRASVSLGKLDFGRTEKKTVHSCYVGMSSAGNLFVKAITDMGTYVYTTRSFSADMKQQRVDFGKGLKTNYVGLEIYNENGSDFELDTVEFHVVDLARRI